MFGKVSVGRLRPLIAALAPTAQDGIVRIQDIFGFISGQWEEVETRRLSFV